MKETNKRNIRKAIGKSRHGFCTFNFISGFRAILEHASSIPPKKQTQEQIPWPMVNIIKSQRDPRVKTPHTSHSPLVTARNWLCIKLNSVGTWAIWQYGGTVLATDKKMNNLNSRRKKAAIRINRMERYFEMAPLRYMQKPMQETAKDHISFA